MRYRITASAAGHKSAETEPETTKTNEQADWHEDVFSDECPWPDHEDVKG